MLRTLAKDCWDGQSMHWLNAGTCLVQDELYTPYLGQLAKLAFLASAVHQAIFTIFSTLPFAVGQVSTFSIEQGMSPALFAALRHITTSCYEGSSRRAPQMLLGSKASSCRRLRVGCLLRPGSGCGAYLSERYGVFHSAVVQGGWLRAQRSPWDVTAYTSYCHLHRGHPHRPCWCAQLPAWPANDSPAQWHATRS